MSKLDISSSITFPESPLDKGVHWTNLEKTMKEYIDAINKISKNSTDATIKYKCEIELEKVRIALIDTSATPAYMYCRVCLAKIFNSKSGGSKYVTEFQKFFLALCDLLPVDKVMSCDIYARSLHDVAVDFSAKSFDWVSALDYKNSEAKNSEAKNSRAKNMHIIRKISTLNDATSVIIRSILTDNNSAKESLEKMKKAINHSIKKILAFALEIENNINLVPETASNYDSLEEYFEILNYTKKLRLDNTDKIKKLRDKLSAWMNKVRSILDTQDFKIYSKEVLRSALYYAARDKTFHDTIDTNLEFNESQNFANEVIASVLKLSINLTEKIRYMKKSDLTKELMEYYDSFQTLPSHVIQIDVNLNINIARFLTDYSSLINDSV